VNGTAYWLAAIRSTLSVRTEFSLGTRLQLVADISALPEPALDDGWAERANSHADLTKIVRRLGARSCTILSLRLAGFTWREIADCLKLNELAVKRSFWREIRRVQNNLPRKPELKKPRVDPELQ
jgi:DNA-binding NarL/FixJ family response regulator